MWSSCDRPRNNDQESPHISLMEWTVCWLDFWSRKWAASHGIISDRIPIGHTFNLVNWFCRERERETWSVDFAMNLSYYFRVSLSLSLLVHIRIFGCWTLFRDHLQFESYTRYLILMLTFPRALLRLWPYDDDDDDRWSGELPQMDGEIDGSPRHAILRRRVVVLGPTADLYNQYFNNKKRIPRLEGAGPDREWGGGPFSVSHNNSSINWINREEEWNS